MLFQRKREGMQFWKSFLVSIERSKCKLLDLHSVTITSIFMHSIRAIVYLFEKIRSDTNCSNESHVFDGDHILSDSINNFVIDSGSKYCESMYHLSKCHPVWALWYKDVIKLSWIHFNFAIFIISAATSPLKV